MLFYARQRLHFMSRIVKSVAVFTVALFGMTIVCIIFWQVFVTEFLYDCTDDNILGFLTPGNWVHFYHGVIYVPRVVHGRSMSEPDSIKAGWSVMGLWCLWYSFVSVSLVVSALLARKTWIICGSDKRKRESQPSF